MFIFDSIENLEETNMQHFFNENQILDTIMLLTCDDHPRQECRLFKYLLTNMSTKELCDWLNSPRDKRFNW